jgi:hypothetical protein
MSGFREYSPFPGTDWRPIVSGFGNVRRTAIPFGFGGISPAILRDRRGDHNSYYFARHLCVFLFVCFLQKNVSQPKDIRI